MEIGKELQSILTNLSQDYRDISRSLNEANVSLAQIKTDVANHIRRTENLEHRYDALYLEQQKLDKQVTKWAGGLALSGWIVATVISISAVITKFIA